MDPLTRSSPRSDAELLAATRVFASERRAQSWWALWSTLAILAGALTLAALASWWPLRAAASVFGALVLVRCFILYHDFMHLAILRRSRVASAVMYLFGLFFLTPPRSWRESHNFHHANVGKLAATGIGSFPLMTTAEWRQASSWRRFRYRVIRHPLTILSAYLTVFAITITLQPLVRNPRRHWDSALAILFHGGLVAGLWIVGGPDVVLFALIIPFALATALGAYLFYAQHDFPGMRIVPLAAWSRVRASLESCSYLQVGPAMRWFTGNIGYHHVHHLNAAIPFYRLPDAFDAIPELERPADTSLWPRDVIACLRLGLWDEETGRMVSTAPAEVAGRARLA
ncbi:MAG TPA: fatty acid desaturase [Kofleriaceae bacterium]|nr:fatty acid desaturase [Kofleriaceae bacterium]